VLVEIASHLQEPYSRALTLLAPALTAGFLWIVHIIKRIIDRRALNRAVQEYRVMIKSSPDLSDSAVKKISVLLENALLDMARNDLSVLAKTERVERLQRDVRRLKASGKK